MNKTKVILSLCAILVILGGIAILAASAAYFPQLDIVPEDQKSFGIIILGVLIGLGAFMALLGLLALFETFRNSKCLLLSLNICMGLFFFIFMAIGIACLYFISSSTMGEIEDCRNISFLRDADNYARDANKYLCSTLCPCNADLTIIKNQINSVSGFWNDTNLMVYNQKGAIKVQDCSNFNTAFSSSSKYFGIVAYLEEQFSCSGICTRLPYYTFSDLRRGIPEERCSKKFVDFVKKFGSIIGSICVILGFVLILDVICSRCFKREWQQVNTEET